MACFARWLLTGIAPKRTFPRVPQCKEREVGSRLDREHLVKALAELPENRRRTIELFLSRASNLHEICESSLNGS
jgi:hypothetical protein